MQNIKYLLPALALILVACSPAQDGDDTTLLPTGNDQVEISEPIEVADPIEVSDPSEVTDPSATSEEADMRTIEIEAGSFYYEPSEIRVSEGETVRLVFNSVDMMHDFNIDELGLTIPVTEAGETATVEFTADQAGEFEFYCSVGQHRAQGQVGTLIVE